MNILDPFLDKKLIQNTLEVIFSLKEFNKKNFSSKFQFSAKVMMAPPGGQTITKKIDLWSTRKYSKISKICLTCASIFLRLWCRFKSTVSTILWKSIKPSRLPLLSMYFDFFVPIVYWFHSLYCKL